MAGWMVAVVLLREFGVSGLRLIAVEHGRVIAAAKSGKLKTGVTMVSLGIMIASPYLWPAATMTIDLVCSWLIIITTVYSGIEYFVRNADVFKDTEKP